MDYTADFETITDPEDCRVWAYAMTAIKGASEEGHKVRIGNSIEDYMCYVEAVCRANAKYRYATKIYFHNLKFDGTFILNYLFRAGYEFRKDRKSLEPHTFTSIITEDGLFYSIIVCFSQKGKKQIKVEFCDSLKILDMSIRDMAKAFGLPMAKGEIDYNAYREPGHIITPEEEEYIRGDVLIAAQSLEKFWEITGVQKLTIASTALQAYKDSISTKSSKTGRKNNVFKKWFPAPEREEDAYIRKAYRGGFVYVNEKYQNKDIKKKGIVLDVNSLYPSVMYNDALPYGKSEYFLGKYEYDDDFPLAIFHVNFFFKVKKNHIPCIQLKNTMRFADNEYIKESTVEPIDLWVTNVDWQLIQEQYDVWDVDYIDGFKYHAAKGMFKTYIDYYMALKERATIENNKAMRTTAKKMLNSLYGKFATRATGRLKEPFLDDEGVVRYRNMEEEEKDLIYSPMAIFIIAYARFKTISSAQRCYKRFLYADTDSLHLLGEEIPEGLEIHETKLGAWKHEGTFTKARYIRQKTYIEDMIIGTQEAAEFLKKNPELSNLVDVEKGTILKVTASGMPARSHKYVTYNNFKEGSVFGGKMTLRSVVNGMVLNEGEFTIKLARSKKT